MAETLASLQNAVLHALGKTPASTTTTTLIVNEAKDFFCNWTNWNWRDKEMSLNTTAAQNYVLLADDFEQLISLRSGTSATRAIVAASLDEIMTMRQLQSGVGGYYYYAVSYRPASSLYMLEIYPTPSASETGTFAGRYRRTCADISSTPDLPAWTHAALKQLVRAWALLVEEHRQEADWNLAMDMMERCRKIDGSAQVMLGMPRFRVGTTTNADEDMDDVQFTPFNGISA